MPLKNLLDEMCEVSTMKATAALSKFLNTPVAVDMKPVEIQKIDQIDLYMDGEEKVASVSLEIKGNIEGASFVFWSQEEALAMCDELYHKPKGDIRSFREADISSSLKERISPFGL